MEENKKERQQLKMTVILTFVFSALTCAVGKLGITYFIICLYSYFNAFYRLSKVLLKAWYNEKLDKHDILFTISNLSFISFIYFIYTTLRYGFYQKTYLIIIPVALLLLTFVPLLIDCWYKIKKNKDTD